MTGIILFNKPFQVLSQFTDAEGRSTLADYLDAPGFRPAGRLDYDSEGLLILTDNGKLQQQIANPATKTPKRYLAQVEGEVDSDALQKLRDGVVLKDGATLPAQVRHIEEPALWPRNPPIRHRANIPTHWLAITIIEGRNRQVRRMTAAVGLPTLRLVRESIGPWSLEDLQPGEFRRATIHLPTTAGRRRSRDNRRPRRAR
jgi:23S rRNA pseudouridine2457 synthase